MSESSLAPRSDSAPVALCGPPAAGSAGDLGPAGQRAFPLAGAQLGLDGRDYVPAAQPPLRPEGPNRPLGPPHAVSLQRQDRSDRQLTFDRLLTSHHLLAGGLFDRQAKCQRTRRVRLADVPLTRSERGAWSARGLVTCGHWTCPHCGPYKARNVAGTIGAAMRRWLLEPADGHVLGPMQHEDRRDVWMISLTVPHYRTDDTGVLVAQLYDAAAHFFRSRTWQEFESEFGVRARVRVLDVTFGGKNGTHPHFHCALFLDGAPGGFRHRSRAQREEQLDGIELGLGVSSERTLVEAWQASVERAGIVVPDDTDFRDVAVKVTPSERASSYFTKWGLSDEVAATPLKRDNHLTLLDAVAAGDDRAGQDYVTWRAAVDGKQWVTGLEDARRRIGVTDEDIDAFVADLRAKRDAECPPVLVRPISVLVRAYLWSRALQLGLPAVMREAARADAAGEDVQRAVDHLLWAVLPRSNPSRIAVESSA